MDRKILNEKAKLMNGITCYEWGYIKTVIDEAFRRKNDELKKTLQLEEDADYEDIINFRLG